MATVERRGSEEWLAAASPLKVERVTGAQLTVEVGQVVDGPSAAQAATRLGWLQKPSPLGPAAQGKPPWHPGAVGLASDFDWDPPAQLEGERVERWIDAGNLVRAIRDLRRAASALERHPGSEVDRRAIQKVVQTDDGKVVWWGAGAGRVSVELPIPAGADRRRGWPSRLRALPPADGDLIQAAYFGAAVLLQHRSTGHVSLSASLTPGWPAEAQGVDLYGRLLVTLAADLGRAIAKLGEGGEDVRCTYCGKHTKAARRGRMKYCSPTCRWSARRLRKRDAADLYRENAP